MWLRLDEKIFLRRDVNKEGVAGELRERPEDRRKYVEEYRVQGRAEV